MNRIPIASAPEALASLPDWKFSSERGGSIAREFRFADFVNAFSFMAQVALHAEKRDHHPEWTNVYDRVTILLTTHDFNGLSMKDIELARLIDRVYAAYGVPAV